MLLEPWQELGLFSIEVMGQDTLGRGPKLSCVLPELARLGITFKAQPGERCVEQRDLSLESSRFSSRQRRRIPASVVAGFGPIESFDFIFVFLISGGIARPSTCCAFKKDSSTRPNRSKDKGFET